MEKRAMGAIFFSVCRLPHDAIFKKKTIIFVGLYVSTGIKFVGKKCWASERTGYSNILAATNQRTLPDSPGNLPSPLHQSGIFLLPILHPLLVSLPPLAAFKLDHSRVFPSSS